MKEKLPVVKPKTIIEGLKQENPGVEIVSYLIPAAVFNCSSFNLLVELVTGGVVVDIDSNNVINIPGLDEISMNELAILEQGFKLGKFTTKDISLGMNSFRVESILSDLLHKKLVTIIDKEYEVTDRFKILHNTKDYATKETIKIQEVEGTKLDAKISLAQVRERIGSMVKVYNVEECWILYHKLK